MLRTLSRISILLVLLSICQYSSQQYWKNSKIAKLWEPIPLSNSIPEASIDLNQNQQQQEQVQQQPETQNEQSGSPKSYLGTIVNPSHLVHPAPAPAVYFNNPVPAAPLVVSQVVPQVLPAAPVFHPVPAPGPVAVVPVGPYAIQQPTITNTGETIIENLIGGIPFDCLARPTGHWRDTRYCDVFHACVHGQQRKTYSCPFVGERTYFDEITRRCEFASKNPLGCAANVWYH